MVNKKILLIFPLLAVFAASCISKPFSFNSGVIDKSAVRIAVLNFKDYNGSTGNNSGELVRNIFEGKLRQRGYGIVGIEKFSSSVKNESLEKDGLTSKWFIDTGKASGADYIIYGSVHDYTIYQSYTTFIYIFGWLELTSSVGVTARMVSCSTGEVVWSGSITRKSYTLNDAAEEAVYELIRTIKHRPDKKSE